MKTTSSEDVVYTNCFFVFCFDIQNNLCTQPVQSLYFSCTELLNSSMNNLLSLCGLVHARIRASEKDLPANQSRILPMSQFVGKRIGASLSSTESYRHDQMLIFSRIISELDMFDDSISQTVLGEGKSAMFFLDVSFCALD